MEKLMEALEQPSCVALVALARAAPGGLAVALAEAMEALTPRARTRFHALLLQRTLADVAAVEVADAQVSLQAVAGVALVELPRALAGDDDQRASLLASQSGGNSLKSLLAVASALHDGVLLAPRANPATQAAVARVCEAWWSSNAPGRADLAPRLVPYLVLLALGGRNTPFAAGAVRRLATARGAMAFFDYDDGPSIDGLRQLILQATFAPRVVRSPDGRRWLSACLVVHPELTREMMAVIRNQAAAARKPVLDAYGDVLWRALRPSPGAPAPSPWSVAARGALESAVAAIMDSALHARGPSLHEALRSVLGSAVFSRRGLPGADALAARLLGPLLPRAMSAARGEVRAHAAALAGDSFPLVDPDAGAVATSAAIAEQLGSLGAALHDSVPTVRAAAAEAVGRALACYWELIPAATGAALLADLGDVCARDASSPVVRAAAVAALTRLVNQPLAHPACGVLLPRVTGPALGDPSPRVRAEATTLLLAVRCCRTLHFYDAAPVPILLAALGGDPSPVVGAGLAQLLLSSYVPEGAPGNTARDRLLALCAQAPSAARRLCSHYVTAGGTPAGGAALAGALAAALDDGAGEGPVVTRPHVVTGRRRRRLDDNDSDDDDDNDALPPAVWTAALTALTSLVGAVGTSAAQSITPAVAQRLWAASRNGPGATIPAAAAAASLVAAVAGSCPAQSGSLLSALVRDWSRELTSVHQLGELAAAGALPAAVDAMVIALGTGGDDTRAMAAITFVDAAMKNGAVRPLVIAPLVIAPLVIALGAQARAPGEGVSAPAAVGTWARVALHGTLAGGASAAIGSSALADVAAWARGVAERRTPGSVSNDAGLAEALAVLAEAAALAVLPAGIARPLLAAVGASGLGAAAAAAAEDNDGPSVAAFAHACRLALAAPISVRSLHALSAAFYQGVHGESSAAPWAARLRLVVA